MPPYMAQQAPPLGESMSAATPTITNPRTRPAATPKPPKKKECANYNSGWIFQGLECPRERDGGVCPYNHNPASREAAIAKKIKIAEEKKAEKKAAKAALTASSESNEKIDDPRCVQSLKLSQSDEALKDEPQTPNPPSQYQCQLPPSTSPALPEQQVATPAKSTNPKRVKKMCRNYSKYGACQKVGCVFRHVEPLNLQKREEGEIKGADVKRSSVSSPSKDEIKPTVPTQNGYCLMLPQPVIGTPPPSQNQFLPLLPLCTPSPESQEGIQKFRPQPPIGTPSFREAPLESKEGYDAMYKPSLAAKTDSVMAETNIMSAEEPITHIPIHTLLFGSMPLNSSIRLKPTEVCRFFQQTGGCKYNKNCYRSHESPLPQLEDPPLQMPPEHTTAAQENINHGISAISGVHSCQSEQMEIRPTKENVVPAPNDVQTSTQSFMASSLPQKRGSAINARFCTYFANTGQCKYGTGCRYLHVNRAEQDIQERLKRVQKLFVSPLSNTTTSQDASQESSKTSNNTAIGSLQDARQENQTSTSKLATSSPSNIESEASLAKTLKLEFPGQNSINSSSPQMHTTEPSSSNQKKVKVLCKFYTRVRGCRHGENCRYLHADRQQTAPFAKDETNGQFTTKPLSNKPKTASEKVLTSDTSQPLEIGDLEQAFKGKGYPEHKAQGRSEGDMKQSAAQHLKVRPSQRTLEPQEPIREAPKSVLEQTLSSIERSSQSPERKYKNLKWWKADPLEEPSVEPGVSWSEAAKLPGQKASSFQPNPGPISAVKKAPLLEVPVVHFRPGVKVIEAIPFDPNVKTTDMDCSGSWDQGGSTLVNWLAKNLDHEKCAKVYAKYRNYLEQGVIPLNALKKKKRRSRSDVGFPLFSLLPTELQTQIWEYALCHKTDVVVRTKVRCLRYEKELYVLALSIPPLLHVCQLSRKIATHDEAKKDGEQHYNKVFGLAPQVYFNFEFNRLVIRNAEATSFLELCNQVSSRQLRRLRYLSIPMAHWTYNEEDLFKEAVVRLSGLQELTLYVGSNECDRRFWEPRNIRERLEKKIGKLWMKFYPAATPPRVSQEEIDPITAYHLGITDALFAGVKVERETWGRKQARLDYQERLYAEGKLRRPVECEIGNSRGIWEGLKN